MNEPVKFFLVQPGATGAWGRCIHLRGWAFAAGGQPIQGIRLTTGAITWPGTVGLPRPDVKAALPEAPDR